MRPLATGLLSLTTAAALAFASTLAAQSVPPTPPAASRAAVTNAVIELSPFTVTSEKDTGYVATNTLAGSRLNSSLKETPGALDVLTKDFLDDIGATTLFLRLPRSWTLSGKLDF